MVVYVVKSQALHSTSSYFDVEAVYESLADARVHIETSTLDFIHGAERGDYGKDFKYSSLEVTDLNGWGQRIEDTDTGYWSEWEIYEFEVTKATPV